MQTLQAKNKLGAQDMIKTLVMRLVAAVFVGVSSLPALTSAALCAVAFFWSEGNDPSPNFLGLVAWAVLLSFGSLVALVVWPLAYAVAARGLASRLRIRCVAGFASGWVAGIISFMLLPSSFMEWFLD
jgi:hypothetical protein